MIPKRLFFIWFGEKECPYKDICLKSYTDLNPDFEIGYIYEKNIFRSSNDDIKECMELVNTEGNFFNEVYNRPHRKEMLTKYDCYNTNFSFVFRFYMWSKYGGIYVDMDTLCYRPFDDEILNKEFFFSNNSTFFQGGVKGFIKNEWKSKMFEYLRAKNPYFAVDNCRNNLFDQGNDLIFKDSYFKEKQEYGKYILHFRKQNWRDESKFD